MPDDDNIPRLASLIPEIYYELIARIPPGMLLVLFALEFWRARTRSLFGPFIGSGDSLMALVVLLGAAWAVGILLSPIAYLLRKRFRRHIWTNLLVDNRNKEIIDRVGKRLGLPGESPISIDGADTIDRRLQDYVQHELEHARMILPKMEAEGILAAHLAAALVLLPILHAVFRWIWGDPLRGYFWLWYLILLAPIAGALCVCYHYTKGLAYRLVSFLYVLENSNHAEIDRIVAPSVPPLSQPASEAAPNGHKA